MQNKYRKSIKKSLKRKELTLKRNSCKERDRLYHSLSDQPYSETKDILV